MQEVDISKLPNELVVAHIKEVSKIYRQGETKIEVLRSTNLQILEGETVAILGQSGSGKSTLLSLLAGLDRPDSGEVFLAGQNIVSMNESELATFRAKNLSIVFQQFHLMPHLNAIENVSLPLEIAKAVNAEEKAREALMQVGLSHRYEHLPHQLSGGEKQRVAIARALVMRPKLLLADEPSGNLDARTGDEVMQLLFEEVKKAKMALILVTHNESLAEYCDRKLKLIDGKLV